MKKTLSKIIIATCVIFSIIILVICSGIAVIGVEEGFGLDHTIVFALFILSFVVSCTNTIYSHTNLHSALKYVIHLVVTLFAAAVFMRVVNGLEGSTILIAEVIIAILHAAIFAIISAIKKSGKKGEKYQSVYNKSNDN